MKKILITLFFVIIFSSLVFAALDEPDYSVDYKCEDYTYGNCPKECEKVCTPSLCDDGVCTDDCNGPGSCIKKPIDKDYTQLDRCVKECKEVICKNEGEECRSKCIRGCKADFGNEPLKGDKLTCLQCGDGCAPADMVVAAMCAKPTKELNCGVEDGKCIIIEDDDSFFEELEDDLTEEELKDIRDLDIGSGGITPDSPFYFIDEAFASLFGEDREEKIAEIIAMIEKGNYDAARIAMRKYEDHVDVYVKKASPENREAARNDAVRIHQILRQIEEKIPPGYREEFIEGIIESEKGLVTAVEIASKIKELCESLADLDPVEYSKVCKTREDSPDWQKKLDKELTNDQKEEAEKFGNIMADCFESSGKDCRCDEIPFPQFAEACSRAAPLAQACEVENDEKACKKLDNFQMPRLPPHLEEVMMELDGKVMKSKFDLHMPPECEGATSPKECERIMIKTNAPEECREALLAADVDNEREGRKICDKIMMEKHSPECTDKGITDPEECARFMDSFRGDDFKDNGQGPRIDFNCKEISDPTERLECFDKASSQAKGYKGHDDKDYEGLCMTESDWKDKKQECRELYGEHAGDEPIMGDSGDGYECVVDAKCVDFGYKDDYVAPEECKSVGALSKEACEKHMSDVAKLGPGCDDCESNCPGASRTDCVNDRCECYYDDKGPGCDDCASECESVPGKLLSGTDCVNNKCECYYRVESECKDGCNQECGDQNSDCVDDKCVCLGYSEGDESDGDDSTDTEGDDTGGDGTDTEGDKQPSLSSDSGSDDSDSSDSKDDSGDSSDSNAITGNAFLDYWYN